MKISRLKAKDYSIIIGKNSITTLSYEVKKHCPKCKKIALIIDKKIPKKFLVKISMNVFGKYLKGSSPEIIDDILVTSGL